jgi:hypothetical protein
MTNKQRTLIETFTFCGFACIISTVTMLGFAGVDPFTPNNALSNTTAKVAQ